ncbi:MAG: 30S ribosome-binding factor RbfA [Bacteroidetes bacterium]|nr:MAG: 30S ribosome-binding factor RbfA [Bacteroidota bacterium]RLD80832.1 MAG: 30S ribosome-binding factor RbfA [Bacteroidota bacterium]
MESKRQQRISRLLQKDLGEIFQHEAGSFSGGAMITVTKVNVTRDLAISRVYLSIFGTEEKEALLEKIRGHKNEIKYKLGNRIRNQLRAVPDLEFYQDDSLDYIENIDRLLQ